MPPTKVTLVAHTHWDREWYEPFEVFRAHLVETMDEALDDLERDQRLHFTLDGQVAMIDDYLEIRPGEEPRIKALVKAGRLHVGPWYTQADTLLVDGEGLLRNLALGLRRAEALGGAMRLGYMPDQFGHAAQLPQWLSQFGIDGAVLWRGVGPDEPPHAFRWQAPDGSAVTALWLRDGYGSGRRIPSDPVGFADAVDRTIERLGSWLGELPLLIPIGDDHVKLAAWLPAAADALSARHPEMTVQIGGYHHHLPNVGQGKGHEPPEHTVHGELRSPAFAPVLANVASARMWEKVAAHRAQQLLMRYAEPMAAWAARVGAKPSEHLLERAWRQLFYNQAHDSAAGCGVDLAHDDVKGRYRWAEQLAGVARDQALAQLKLELPAGDYATAFAPVPTPGFLIQAEMPRSLEGTLVSVGPDGVSRPVQLLSDVVEPPVFEGEFSAEELSQYLGGIDPATPLFGKYLSGIVARDEGGGLVRLDVGLGEKPVTAQAIAEDQQRVAPLLAIAKRFKIVMHGSGATRPMLLSSGPAKEASFVPIAVKVGTADGSVPTVRVESEGQVGTTQMVCGSLSVTAHADGTVSVRDADLPIGAVRANDLVDQGDRGDLYHFDAAGEPLRSHAAVITVLERGPLRARLRIESEMNIPAMLADDRSKRSTVTRTTRLTSEVTLTAGQRAVEFVTTLHNESADHRLRALVHAPFAADRIDAEHGMAILERPLDTTRALGVGTERAAPTGQHHLFVDVTNGKAGVALMSRGLIEHEVVSPSGAEAGSATGTHVALTLLRSVGWLSRGDLSTIDHAAGPMVATPMAQEIGAHRFEYAVLLHAGDWEAGQVLPAARRYAAPVVPVKLKGKRPVPAAVGLVDVTPSQVMVTALHPALSNPRALVARLLNSSAANADVVLKTAFPLEEMKVVNPMEEPMAEPRARVEGGAVRLSLRPWQVVTLLLR